MGAELVFTPESIEPDLHPAFTAWTRLHLASPVPESIEVLTTRRGKRPNRKSSVYRLNGIGPNGSSVISKQTKRSSALVERLIYRDVLPLVSLPSLHCFGAVGCDSGDDCWLFLEEARGVWYDEQIAAHRALAARWLGITHTTTGMMNLASQLPAHGPDDYLVCLREGRSTIERNLCNPSLTGDDLLVLKAILERFDLLELHWNDIEKMDEGMPQCLVHCDISGKNLRVHTEDGNSTLYVLDWDIAGWGAPAVDIERIDLNAYWVTVREHWPYLGLEGVRAMADLGVLLRNIGLIEATSIGLAYEWVESTMWELKLYSSRLAAALPGLQR